MSISLIVAATTQDGVIGNKGKIPWHLKSDMARFKRLTEGHIVVMGRKTWESLSERFRPLPNRGNIVLSSDPLYRAPGALVVHKPDALMGILEHIPDEIFIIGGSEIYDYFLCHASTIYLTEVEAKIDGDAHFPYWDMLRNIKVWEVVSQERVDAGEGNQYASVFIELRRNLS